MYMMRCLGTKIVKVFGGHMHSFITCILMMAVTFRCMIKTGRVVIVYDAQTDE